jgi:hypothetical protein
MIAKAVLSAAFVCSPILAADAPQIQADNSSAGLKVPAPQASKSTWMSPEAAEVLKLVRSNVNDEVIMAYIQNSKGFTLTADDIVQLHNEGVADKMINAMLNHRKAVQPMIATQQPQAVQAVQPQPQQQVIQPTQPPPMIAAQPQTTYVQSIEAQPVYVPSTTYVYNDSYPYYAYDPYYWNWWYPSVGFSFGFGYPHYYGHYYPRYTHYYAPHYYGGYRGGYVGGYHGGGGFHGGYVGGGSRGGFGVGVHWGGHHR